MVDIKEVLQEHGRVMWSFGEMYDVRMTSIGW
jgi:hypothetical protein